MKRRDFLKCSLAVGAGLAESENKGNRPHRRIENRT